DHGRGDVDDREPPGTAVGSGSTPAEVPPLPAASPIVPLVVRHGSSSSLWDLSSGRTSYRTSSHRTLLSPSASIGQKAHKGHPRKTVPDPILAVFPGRSAHDERRTNDLGGPSRRCRRIGGGGRGHGPHRRRA